MRMHPFPPIGRHLAAALAAVIVTAAGAAALALPAQAAPSLNQLQTEARQVHSQMLQLNAGVAATEQQYEQAQKKLDLIDQQLTQTRVELAHAQTALDAQVQVVADRAAMMYKTGDTTLIEVLLTSSSFTDLQSGMDYFDRILQQDQDQQHKLLLLTQAVQGLQADQESRRNEAMQVRSEIQDKRATLEEKIAERGALLKDLTARIKKMIAAQARLLPAGGKVTQLTWARALLLRLGDPVSQDNLAALVAWEMAEGGHWYNTAHYNPLNTTQSMPGATSMNSVGVKAYRSWAQGLEATVITLHNGNYPGILAALKRGDNAQAVADAVVSSPWGTHTIHIS